MAGYNEPLYQMVRDIAKAPDGDTDEIIERCASRLTRYSSWAQRRYAIPPQFSQALNHLKKAGANSCIIEDMVRMAFDENDASMLPPSVMARAALPFVVALKHDVPFWCVDKHLYDQLCMTTPPDKWECHVPFPSGFLLLPEELPGGVRCLGWTRVNRDADMGYFNRLLGKGKELPEDLDLFIFTAVMPDGSSVFSHTGVLNGDLVDFSTLDGAPFAVASDPTGFIPEEREPNDTDWFLVEKTPRLLANLLAALTLPGFSDESNHRIVGRVKAKAPAGSKQKKVKVDKWGVRILRDPVPPVKGVLNTGSSGHHSSPKVHWRRGHWHTVLHGKGRLQRKLKWFRPTLVGIRDNDDTEQNDGQEKAKES